MTGRVVPTDSGINLSVQMLEFSRCSDSDEYCPPRDASLHTDTTWKDVSTGIRCYASRATLCSIRSTNGWMDYGNVATVRIAAEGKTLVRIKKRPQQRCAMQHFNYSFPIDAQSLSDFSSRDRCTILRTLRSATTYVPVEMIASFRLDAATYHEQQ